MSTPDASRALGAEFLGALLLTATVVGSGIMAERLSGGNAGLALLANTFATVAVLAVLIATLGPLSGAHFNPVVSMVSMIRGQVAPPLATGFIAAQLAGCCAGAALANLMFDLPAVAASTQARSGPAMWLSEVVASAGLVLVAFRSPNLPEAAWRVAAWIGAAYWFTASTSFANPAITLGRTLSDSFAGIRPADAPGFIAAQLAGGALGLLLLHAFSRYRTAT